VTKTGDAVWCRKTKHLPFVLIQKLLEEQLKLPTTKL